MAVVGSPTKVADPSSRFGQQTSEAGRAISVGLLSVSVALGGASSGAPSEPLASAARQPRTSSPHPTSYKSLRTRARLPPPFFPSQLPLRTVFHQATQQHRSLTTMKQFQISGAPVGVASIALYVLQSRELASCWPSIRLTYYVPVGFLQHALCKHGRSALRPSPAHSTLVSPAQANRLVLTVACLQGYDTGQIADILPMP
jgi:hypothetical protein